LIFSKPTEGNISCDSDLEDRGDCELAEYFSDEEEDYLDQETAIGEPEASTLDQNQYEKKSENKDNPRIDPTFIDFVTSKGTGEAHFKGTASKTNQA
jgi:hypothetical protein